MRDRNKLVIWPVYIDKNRSRSNGRIISKKSSVAEPTLGEIEKAALKLGLNPEVEKDKSYPKYWWEKSGRVLIDNSAPKTHLSRKIAATIKDIRSE
jgi:signal recognition particle subunit SRP19